MTDVTAPPSVAVLRGVCVAVGVGWGATYLLSKFATSTGHDPLGITLITAVMGAFLTTLAMVLMRKSLPLGRPALVFYLVCGIVGTALPNTLSYITIKHLPVGIVAILNAIVPMLTLLLSWLVGLEKPQWRRVMGLLLGAGAVMLIAIPQTSLPKPGDAFWVLLALIVALSYASENVIVDKWKPKGCDALCIMTGLSWAAVLLVLPAVIATGGWVDLSPWSGVEVSLIAMGLLHIACYLGLVWVIDKGGAVFAAQIGYIVTLSGVFWGMVILGERHSGWIWAALAMMFVGLALVRPREDGGHSEL